MVWVHKVVKTSPPSDRRTHQGFVESVIHVVTLIFHASQDCWLFIHKEEEQKHRKNGYLHRQN